MALSVSDVMVQTADGRSKSLNDYTGDVLLIVNVAMSSCWDAHSFVVPVVGHAKGLSASSIGLVLGSFAAAATLVRLAIVRWAHHVDEVKAQLDRWLTELAPRAAPDGPPIVSIWSWHDSMVAPQTSSRLDGARNIELVGIGHNALLRDPQALQCVLEEYRAAETSLPALATARRPTSESPA